MAAVDARSGPSRSDLETYVKPEVVAVDLIDTELVLAACSCDAETYCIGNK